MPSKKKERKHSALSLSCPPCRAQPPRLRDALEASVRKSRLTGSFRHMYTNSFDKTWSIRRHYAYPHAFPCLLSLPPARLTLHFHWVFQGSLYYSSTGFLAYSIVLPLLVIAIIVCILLRLVTHMLSVQCSPVTAPTCPFTS